MPVTRGNLYRPAWKEVLRACNLPLTVVVLDWETYFDEDYSIRKMGTVQYISDPRFEVLGLASFVATPDNAFPPYETETRWHPAETSEVFLRELQRQYGDDLGGCTIVMQNAKFDAAILAFKYGIFPKHIIDVMGLARAWNARSLHGLEDLTKRWGLPEKGDTKEFLGVTLRSDRLTKPKGRGKNRMPLPRPIATQEQLDAVGGYARNDVMREWELFTLLLPRLSRPEVELQVMHDTIELFTVPGFRVDEVKAHSIMERMKVRMAEAIAPCGLTEEAVSADTTFEQALQEALGNSGDDAEQYKKQTKRPVAGSGGTAFKRCFAIAKSDPEREVLGNHPDETVRNLMAAKGAVDSWPNHISRVQAFIDHSRPLGGWFPNPLKYHGAQTGRDAGDEGLNTQNLGSRGDKLIAEVREILVVDEDGELVIIDLMAVEARGTAYIAGQDDLIEKFKRNEEVYCGLASKILGWSVRKPIDEGKPGYEGPEIEDQHKRGRGLGKVGILGMGYGMGKDRAYEYANGAPYFCDATREMTDRLVDVYRSENTAITGFWKASERAFLYTAKYGRSCHLPRGLAFEPMKDGGVCLTLPSGRELHYLKVKVAYHERGDKLEVWNGKEHRWEHLWGGTITENVVQAFCRDILMENSLALKALGVRTIHRVHDELVLKVKKGEGAGALKDGLRTMSTSPTWAPGLPLGAEGKVTQRYGGH